MSKTAHLIWTIIGISIVAAMLIAATVWGFKMRPTDTPCTGIEYIIEDRAERLYVTERELQQVLEEEHINPVGKALNTMSLHRIEKAIERHPMVRTAECYLTPRNEVKVRLTQRVPLLRVQTPGDAYFIDTDRKVMQARAAVRDTVLIVTGAVGVQIASNQLANFALWLQDTPFWQKRIHHVFVQSPQTIYVYQKGNQPRILIGSMRDYERKMKKMRTFYENAADIIQDKNYAEYDVRFSGQVIGRY